MENKDTSKKLFQISMLKSLNRITAGLYLLRGDLFYAGLFLIMAEVVGIIEEL